MPQTKKIMKIAVGSFYIRRRDKRVAIVQHVDGQHVRYIAIQRSSRDGILKSSMPFNVSLNGFCRGFRELTEEEKERVKKSMEPQT